MHLSQDTIVAAATAPGSAAIAVVRLSGKDAFGIVSKIWRGKSIQEMSSHTLHLGKIVDENNQIIDEVLLSIFRAPHSFTKEDSIELSLHGSPYIVQRVLALLISAGARLAEPGEFTRRAYLNGRFDLAQAEAVADLIAAQSAAAHRTALQQMRGGFSSKIKQLRQQLIHFASLIELELDFGEEDVEFANRHQLLDLLNQIIQTIQQLKKSFYYGNALKQGIPVAIIGKPNAGKSTLLNALLQEERAIVSDIAGTTRDTIEDEIDVGGITFRFIDTAGIRQTTDTIEAIGVERAYQKMQEAAIVLYVFDIGNTNVEEIHTYIQKFNQLGKLYFLIANKTDLYKPEQYEPFVQLPNIMFISAHNEVHIEELKQKLLSLVQEWESSLQTDIIISNIRHYEALHKAEESLQRAQQGIVSGLSSDLIVLDIRASLYYLGEITGEISTDDLLSHIFSKFCIGK